MKTRSIFERIIAFINKLLDPRSTTSSKRFVGIVSLFTLAVVAFVSLIPYTIPQTNASLLESICYTLGGVVIGVFIGSVYEKIKSNKDETV